MLLLLRDQRCWCRIRCLRAVMLMMMGLGAQTTESNGQRSDLDWLI
jgi:hypothetical protein